MRNKANEKRLEWPNLFKTITLLLFSFRQSWTGECRGLLDTGSYTDYHALRAHTDGLMRDQDGLMPFEDRQCMGEE